tara:strand:+ start:2034 stop:2393 length:360 start_codon:yes stop_codon:yes gene_type:complete
MQDSRNWSWQEVARLGREAQPKKGETEDIQITSNRIAKAVAENYNLPKEVVRAIIDDSFHMIRESLIAGCRVTISDFGTFRLGLAKAGIHPKSPVPKTSFRMNKYFKQQVKNDRRKNKS